MPIVTKVNPVLRDISRSFVGKTMRGYTIATGVDLSGELGPRGAVQEILAAVAERATIMMHSGLLNSSEDIIVYVEGDFPTDTYDGTNSETFAVYLQSVLVAKTAAGVGPVNLSGTTVTEVAGSPFYADDVPALYV